MNDYHARYDKGFLVTSIAGVQRSTHRVTTKIVILIPWLVIAVQMCLVSQWRTVAHRYLMVCKSSVMDVDLWPMTADTFFLVHGWLHWIFGKSKCKWSQFIDTRLL